MARKDVFDDSKPKPGATRFAAAAAIYTIKTLGKSIQMLLLNAYTRVKYAKYCPISICLPVNKNITALWRVADGVADLVAESAQ